MDKSSIIAKIQGLMQLASNNASQEEAETASKLAQKLLTRYQLSEAEVMVESESEEGWEIDRHDTDVSGNRIAQWKINLMVAIANANDCKIVINSQYDGYSQMNMKTKKTLVVIGTESDAALVKAFFASLAKTVEQVTKASSPAGLGRGEGKHWSNSFKLGCVSAIGTRLREAAAEAKSEAQSEGCGSAIVRIEQKSDALAAFMDSMRLGKSARRQSRVDESAFRHGYATGSRINLSKNVLN